MSKAAQKRVRKEIEKMLSSGQYWEWLEAIEREGLIDEYRKEWHEVCQTLARRAFRDSLHLEDFLLHSTSLKRHSDIPDIRFLLLLKEFIEGALGVEEIASFKGLSPGAEAIRKQAMTWRDNSFPDEKLRESLTALITKPEDVVKKNYEEIALVLKGTRLSGVIKSLGPQMTAARSLGERPDAKASSYKLSDIEFNLKEASIHIPHHLQQILFYPFLFQVRKLLQKLLETKQDTFAEVLHSIPSLLSMLAGEKAGSLKAELAHQNPEGLRYDDLYGFLSKADLEEKVLLLGRMRSSHEDKRSGKADDFQRLYQSLLSDIGRMRPSLSEREKKDLNRVMGSALTRDLHFLWNGLEASEHNLTEILLPAAEAGCLNLRLALLSIVLAEKGGYRRLKAFAENSLRGSNPPAGEEIGWLLGEFSEIIFPHVNSLKPLLSFWGSEPPFANEIAKAIWSKAIAALVLNAAYEKVGGFFPLLSGEIFFEGMKKEIQILKKELSALKDYRDLGNLAGFLNCFPEDFFTEKGYQRLLDTISENGRSLDPIIEIVGDFLLKSPAEIGMDEFLRPLFGDSFKVLEKGFYLFLREHWENLKRATIESLDKLIRILFRRETPSKDRNLLLRISNLLEERFRDGETEAHVLKEKLMEELIRQKAESKLAKPKGRRRSSRLW